MLTSSGRVKASPRFLSSSALISRSAVVPKVSVSGSDVAHHIPFSIDSCQEVVRSPQSSITLPSTSGKRLPLHAVCVGRSGDKGDSANIAIIARHPSFYPHLVSQLTASVIQRHLKHLIDQDGLVMRYLVPGMHAVNFVVTKCLGGGGLGSLRLDRQGKGFAQVILGGVDIFVPDDIVMEQSKL